ncbi:MAG: N-acetyl-gamma-glutamyl-phosphate reductase [Syntrophobacteraceae bacterium]
MFLATLESFATEKEITSKMDKINICIIGARSLSSGSLMKLLLQHKHVNIKMLISEEEGEDIEKIHSCLLGVFHGKTEKYNKENIVENCDMIFLHKSHGQALDKTSELVELALEKKKDVKFIDLSADFRLKDKNLYDKWYNFSHKQPQLLQQAIYGLTELNRDKIKSAFLVANPGCYPTAAVLGLAPLLKNHLVDNNQDIVIDALSGFSGAGKLPNGMNMAMNITDNVIPYKIGGKHQHIPEIEQELSDILGAKVLVAFSPHVAPFKYGILSTSYVKLKETYEWSYVHELYKKMYKNEPFIHIMDEDVHPEVKDVESTNFCNIGFSVDKRTKMCIVISAIDNVVKGASGQAIQNMNVMYGFDETEGLPYSDALKKLPAL